MTIIEDGLMAEIKNFLKDLTSPGDMSDYDIFRQAKELLEKLKGR